VNTFDSSPNYNIDEHMPALKQTPDLPPRMPRSSERDGGVPRSLIAQRVKIPPVRFTRNLSFTKKA
jgi:hypothetical protein